MSAESNAAALTQLAKNLVAAQDAMVAELLRQYPIGSRIGVSIKHGQRNPSPATVSGAKATALGGQLHVEMEGNPLGERHHFRRIPVSQVMQVYAIHTCGQPSRRGKGGTS